MKQEVQAEKEGVKGFDLQVTHFDEAGRVVSKNPYTLTVSKASDGGNTRVFERPVGSGNLWDPQNRPVGRWEMDTKGNRVHNAKAKHVAYVPPMTEDQKLAKDLADKDAKIAALERELMHIQGDKKAPKVQTEKGS